MFGSQISTQELIRFCFRMGTSIQAGLEMRRLWEGEAKRGSVRQRNAMQQVYEAICDGESMVAAMRDTGYFPKLTIAMLEIGELTGRSDQSFQRLSKHYEHQQAMLRQFLRGMAWPYLQLVAAQFILAGVIYILGIVAEMNGGETLFDITGMGLTGAAGAIWFLFITFGMQIAIALPIYGLIKGWFGSKPVEIAMRIPYIGAYSRNSAMGILCWSLGMALDAGLDAPRSVELGIESTQNPFYISKISFIKDEIVEKGTSFYEAFRDADGFPADFLDSMEACELSGTLSQGLLRLSHEYDDEAQRNMVVVTVMANGIIWLGISGLLIYMILSMAMQYIGLINSLTS
jgi:type II secretory pathway component PulF